MIYITLALEFFKIGLFSIGGGLATVPFIRELGATYGWFTNEELIQMIAVSESTPGPIGINMATYVGYKTAGYLGAIITTLFEVMPALIIIMIISTIFQKYKDNKYVVKAFKYIRPCTFALMLTAFIGIFCNSVILINKINETGNIMDAFNIKSLIVFTVIYIFNKNTKYHPLVYIGISALLGVLLSI